MMLLKPGVAEVRSCRTSSEPSFPLLFYNVVFTCLNIRSIDGFRRTVCRGDRPQWNKPYLGVSQNSTCTGIGSELSVGNVGKRGGFWAGSAAIAAGSLKCSFHRNRMSQGGSNPAAVPHAAEDIQGDDRWMSQHNRFVLDCKDKEPDVLFVGDSMVQLLQQYEIWRELFSPLHALNFGIGGDTTGHVLWRLKNGELENIKPKVIVVWVGTNNHENTAEEVAGGIEAIVRLINAQQPQAKVIVLGLLPRGEKPNPLRQKNAKVNHLLKASLPKLPNVQLLDVDAGFVHSDGTISYHDMFDFLHLTGGGYAKICKPLHELIMQLLEETPEEKRAALA